MVAEPLVPNPPPHRFSHIPPIMEADRGTKGKGKAGKSERMEPYEKPAELSDDTVLTNSPVQKEIVARLRHEQAPGDDQAPAVHSMATPTAQGLAPVAPPPGVAPQRGCTPDELYSFVMDQLKGVSQEVADMENRVVVRMGITDKAVHDLAAKVDKLEPLQAHVHDMSVFAKIKNFVTQDNLDGKAEAIEADLNVLKSRLEGFVGQLDGYLTSAENHVDRIQAIETQFKRHVEDNFKVVESECTAIRRIIDQVATGDKEAKVSTDAAVQMQLGVLAENVRQLEAKETQGRFDYNTSHAEQVQVNHNFWQEIGKTQAAVTTLVGASTSTGTGSGGHQGAGNPGEGQGATSSASAGADDNCHCHHFEMLKTRVAALEQERGGRGVDAWGDFLRRREPREAAPIRNPPGFRAPPPASGTLPQAARRTPVANDEFPDMQAYDLNRIFDDKVALSAGFGYDGEKHGETWKRKIRGYWISKCPDILPILNHVEDMDTEEITTEDLKAEANSYRWMTEINIKRISEILWGFLNTCLSGKARTCFEGADMCNEFSRGEVSQESPKSREIGKNRPINRSVTVRRVCYNHTQESAIQRFNELIDHGGYESHQLGIFSREVSHRGQRTFFVDTFAGFALDNAPGVGEPAGAKNRHLYELLVERRPCFLYFDLEFSKGTNSTANHIVIMNAFWTCFTNFCVAVLGGVPGEVVELDSSTDSKFSRHVLVKNLVGSRPMPFVFDSNAQAGIVVCEFLSYLREERATPHRIIKKSVPGGQLLDFRAEIRDRALGFLVERFLKDRAGCKPASPAARLFVHPAGGAVASEKDLEPFIDTSVYSRNRSFRLLGQSKFGKSAVLCDIEIAGPEPPYRLLGSMASHVPAGSGRFQHPLVPPGASHHDLWFARARCGAIAGATSPSCPARVARPQQVQMPWGGSKLLTFLTADWDDKRRAKEPLVAAERAAVARVLVMDERYWSGTAKMRISNFSTLSRRLSKRLPRRPEDLLQRL